MSELHLAGPTDLVFFFTEEKDHKCAGSKALVALGAARAASSEVYL